MSSVQNEEDGDGGSAALTNEIALGTYPPQENLQQRNIFENRGGRRNYIQSNNLGDDESSPQRNATGQLRPQIHHPGSRPGRRIQSDRVVAESQPEVIVQRQEGAVEGGRREVNANGNPASLVTVQ